jgi:DNA-binding transcriptional ArsR family regulator
VKIAYSPLTAKAADAAVLLKALANEQRLLILCHLVSEGELSVGALGERVNLSQSALSQHLARLRTERLVTFRRESQTLYYRVLDPKAEQLLDLLRDLFCPELRPASLRSDTDVEQAPRMQSMRTNGGSDDD